MWTVNIIVILDWLEQKCRTLHVIDYEYFFFHFWYIIQLCNAGPDGLFEKKDHHWALISTPSGVGVCFNELSGCFSDFFPLETYLLQQEIRMAKLLYSQSGFNCVVSCYRLVFFSFLSTSNITCKLVLPGFSKWCHNYQKAVITFWWLQIASCARDNFQVAIGTNYQGRK